MHTYRLLAYSDCTFNFAKKFLKLHDTCDQRTCI